MRVKQMTLEPLELTGTSVSPEPGLQPHYRRVVVFCAGSGNPFFTTDTPAALRAAEIGADLLIKATRVDGIYSADPEVDPNATRLPNLTYLEVLNLRLQVMDNTAITLCMDNRLPLLVLDLFTAGNLARAVSGEHVGSLVSDQAPPS
jgi:uridylate kinase